MLERIAIIRMQEIGSRTGGSAVLMRRASSRARYCDRLVHVSKPCALVDERVNSAVDGARLPWWTHGQSFQGLRTEALQLWHAPKPSSKALEAFRRQCAVDFVFLSCKLEQTVPSSLTREELVHDLEDTYKRCQDNVISDAASPWPSDGSPDDLAANKNQMIQHMKALCFLCSPQYTGSRNEPLTPAVLQKAHSILLNNAINDEGGSLHPGLYRTHPSHSDSGLVFAEPAKIPFAVEQALADYSSSEKHASQSSQFFIERIARLYYALIMIHPFSDGNGRLCRLLIACLLMREGVPFPVPMDNGHKKNRHHYMGVTGYSHAHCNTLRLQCYILECVLLWWKRLSIDL